MGKRFKPEDIILKLREVEIQQGKGLEQENARLKKLVADLSLDNAILKEAARGNF